MAAPSLSAIGSRYFLKFSADWKARPPEITMRAAVIAAGERDDERGERLGKLMFEIVRLGVEHLPDARELCRLGGRGSAVLAGHEKVDVAADRGRGGERPGGRVLQRGIVVVGDE